MSPRSDDVDMTRRDLDDRTADALLSGRVVDGEPLLTEVISELRSLASVPAPAPSTALTLLLEHGIQGAPVALAGPASVSWRRRFTRPIQVSLGAAGCVALFAGAAAANELPSRAQNAVADVVEAVTPLHVPRPHHSQGHLKPVPVHVTTDVTDTVTDTAPKPHAPKVHAPKVHGDDSDRQHGDQVHPATDPGDPSDSGPSRDGSEPAQPPADSGSPDTADTSGRDSSRPTGSGSGPVLDSTPDGDPTSSGSGSPISGGDGTPDH